MFDLFSGILIDNLFYQVVWLRYQNIVIVQRKNLTEIILKMLPKEIQRITNTMPRRYQKKVTEII